MFSYGAGNYDFGLYPLPPPLVPFFYLISTELPRFAALLIISGYISEFVLKSVDTSRPPLYFGEFYLTFVGL